jgi:hypothetical protein
MRRVGIWSVSVLIALVLLIQFVSYGRDHSNPAVRAEPAWDSPRTRELTVRACYDCHSNETTWPWYTNIAPISWLVQSDVERGRAELNYSDPQYMHESSEAAESVLEGEMPPWYYSLPRPRARLTDTERDELMRGLIATFGQEDDDDD